MEAIATGLAVEAAKAMTKIVVSSSAFEELRSLWCVNDDKFVQMKNKLSGIQAFLNDLGKKPLGEIESDLVNGWIQEVKDVACSAENLINDYNYEKLRRKLQFKRIDHNRLSFKKKSIITMKKCRNYMAPSTNPCMFRIRMIHRVDRILLELDGVHKKATENLKLVKLVNYGLDSAPNNTRDKLYHVRKEPPTDTFIGRDQDKENLLQMLRNPTNEAHNDIPIVVIVGLGGLGKTTLARKLYKHDKDHDEGPFNGEKIWICVSEQFDGDKILKEMVGVLTKGETFNSDNTDAIIHKVREKLKGKKLFLVLDDVWNDDEELWDSFKTKLQRIGVPRGSVILITTRLNKVVEATGAGASGSYKLKGLSNDYAWDLLKKLVSFDSSFDDVAKSILRKCRGVPLAIKAIGCTLKQLKNPSDWRQIETSEVWHIEQKDDKDYIMPSLLLSYNHFKEASIKQCFACCAIYPKDRVMEKGELIALWSAQGLLHHDEDKSNNSTTTMETIGGNYIDVLINHSFLLLEKEDEDVVYRTKYKMHDLVHDLATHVLKKDLLVWEAGTNLNDVSHVRHLAVNFKDNDEGAPETVTLPKKEIRKLRTVIFWNYGVSMWKSLNGARYLCTLIMVDIGLEEVPPVIGQLVHLRYLDLSHNIILKSLPESICKLYQLQTLRLLGCWCLKELPRELHKLGNLRHIPTVYPVLASKGLQELTNLQTLPVLWLHAEEGWKIDELGFLKQVKGGICIFGLNHVKNKEEARKADIGNKDKILQLTLKWEWNREESNGLSNDEDVLEGLEPHPNIQSLSVDEYNGVKFPEWIMKMSVKQLQTGYTTRLSQLTKVELSCCKNCQQLPSLGQLPNLKVLELIKFDKVECIGDEFYKSSNNNCREHPSARDEDIIFPSLTTLRIARFERLTTWAAPSSAPEATTAFPCLETLKVEDCPQLEITPYVQPTSLKCVVFDNVGGTILEMAKGSNGLIKLKLSQIEKLRMLPEELSNCSNLQSLEIDDCENLECIPNGLTSLKTLKVEICPSLSSIPDGLSSLETLKVGRCPSLSMLPEELSNCSNLQSLEIIDCENLECIPNGLTSLKTLKVDSCPSLSSIPDGLSSLRNLSIQNCKSLACIPIDFEDCMSLDDLTIGNCPLIAGPIPNMEKLEGLKLLSLKDAGLLSTSSLRWIPSLHGLTKLCLDGLTEEWDISLISSLTSLTSLELINCPNFKALTTQQLPHLPLIGMEKSDVPDLSQLKRLEDLTLFNVGEMMMSAARSIPQLDSLRELYIGGFKDEEEITKFKATPHSHSLSLSLRMVTLVGWPKVKKMPEQLQHLLPSSTLEHLIICNFDELEQLPDWIGNLSSLKDLVLSGCNKLKYLPSKQAMMHLSGLHIIDCPQLKERCQKHSNNENENENGPPHSESQWPNIEHIPYIQIHWKIIQNQR